MLYAYNKDLSLQSRKGIILRGGAVVARRAHNPKVISSSLVPATIEAKRLKQKA